MSGSSASAEAHARWKIPATTSIVIANPALVGTHAKERKPSPILFWTAVPLVVMDMWFAAMIPGGRRTTLLRR